MCQSQSEGGKRCVYADTISNVRRAARYKYKDSWEAERLTKKAVDKWKDNNKDFVTEHLPETKPFQVSPNQKPIPISLINQLNINSRTPVAGLSAKEREQFTEKLYNEYTEWSENKLSKEETNALKRYTISFFEPVNQFLRRKSLSKMIKEGTIRDYPEISAEESLKTSIHSMDSALLKAEKLTEPRKLYRFFRVPAGVNPSQFLDKYMVEGEAFKETGYMSTTADPEFVMAHLFNRNKGIKNSNYIVFEILTKQGASLQSDKEGREGNIQSLEKEVLLPRNIKFRIAGVRKTQKFEFASDRKDLHYNYNHGAYSSDDMYNKYGKFKKGDKMSFPLIQLVDEKLITETNN